METEGLLVNVEQQGFNNQSRMETLIALPRERLWGDPLDVSVSDSSPVTLTWGR